MTTQLPARTQRGDIPIENFGQEMDATIDRLKNDSMKPAMEACVEHVEQGIQENFLNSRTGEGEPWAPRKNPVQIVRDNQGQAYEVENPVLIKTSALLQSMTNSESPDALNEVVDRGLARGSDLDYALPLQVGTKNMPARPMVDVPEPHQEECDEIIADFGLEFF